MRVALWAGGFEVPRVYAGSPPVGAWSRVARSRLHGHSSVPGGVRSNSRGLTKRLPLASVGFSGGRLISVQAPVVLPVVPK
jgi:hypothetical protein